MPIIIIDLRYASKNNFTHQKILNQVSVYFQSMTFEYLCKAIEISRKLGLKIKIFDAYRPVCSKIWNKLPDPNFIAHPDKGSPHSRGVAIDLTLTRNGKELDMGTEFDEFQNYPIMEISKYLNNHIKIDFCYSEL